MDEAFLFFYFSPLQISEERTRKDVIYIYVYLEQILKPEGGLRKFLDITGIFPKNCYCSIEIDLLSS